MKVFFYVYDGNLDVFLFEKFDYVVCDVGYFDLCFYWLSCSWSYWGRFGKLIVNYYSNCDVSFYFNYFKVCGDVYLNFGFMIVNKNLKYESKIWIWLNLGKYLYGSFFVFFV